MWFKSSLILALLAGSQADAAVYNIDASHSDVGFAVQHLMITKVRGKYKTFSGSFDFDEKKKELKALNVEIDANSIDTSNAKRDEHLKSADFFDTAKFPKITFKGEKAEFSGDKPSSIKGDLTMHGVTKPVTLHLEYNGSIVDPGGNTKVGFHASTKIKRSDFGITWNKPLDKAKGVMVGDEVEIIIDGEAALKK